MAREMKDSGFVWLGQIPHDWEIRKLKHYYTLKTGFTPDTKKQEYYDETGYDWVNISDLSDGATIYETRKKISQAYVDAFSPEQIPAGSLMYSFKLSVGQTSFAGKPLFTNEAIASFLASETVDLHYLRYSSSFIIKNAQTNIYNAKILNQDLINNAYVPFPPLAEQARIAAFLDRKCAEIDSVIADTQRTIEEYKKLKQSVITQAVTKGIRGERPMKDSGIEWLGMIPADWNISRLKYVCQINTEFVDPRTGEYDELPHIGPGNIEKFTGRLTEYKLVKDEGLISGKYHFYPNDIVYGKINPQLGKVAFPQFEGLCSADAYPIHTIGESMETRFLLYFMLSRIFIDATILESLRMGMPKINSTDLMGLSITVPSIEEQKEIVDYIDARSQEMDLLIDAKQQMLEALEAYKKSVIYEYVTGKKEVPACQ